MEAVCYSEGAVPVLCGDVQQSQPEPRGLVAWACMVRLGDVQCVLLITCSSSVKCHGKTRCMLIHGGFKTVFYTINKRVNPYNLEGWEGSWYCRCSARCWLEVHSLGRSAAHCAAAAVALAWAQVHCQCWWAAWPMPAVMCPAVRRWGLALLAGVGRACWNRCQEVRMCVLLCCAEEMKLVVLLSALQIWGLSWVLVSWRRT